MSLLTSISDYGRRLREHLKVTRKLRAMRGEQPLRMKPRRTPPAAAKVPAAPVTTKPAPVSAAPKPAPVKTQPAVTMNSDNVKPQPELRGRQLARHEIDKQLGLRPAPQPQKPAVPMGRANKQSQLVDKLFQTHMALRDDPALSTAAQQALRQNPDMSVADAVRGVIEQEKRDISALLPGPQRAYRSEKLKLLNEKLSVR